MTKAQLLELIEQQKQDYDELAKQNSREQLHSNELAKCIGELQGVIESHQDLRAAQFRELTISKRMFEMAYHGHAGLSLSRDNFEATYQKFRDTAVAELEGQPEPWVTTSDEVPS